MAECALNTGDTDVADTIMGHLHGDPAENHATLAVENAFRSILDATAAIRERATSVRDSSPYLAKTYSFAVTRPSGGQERRYLDAALLPNASPPTRCGCRTASSCEHIVPCRPRCCYCLIVQSDWPFKWERSDHACSYPAGYPATRHRPRCFREP